jgi:hypothetical protein
MRTLVTAALFGIVTASSAMAQPLHAWSSWGYEPRVETPSAQHQVRSYEACYALAIARGFSIMGSESTGAERRNAFIRDCEAGTQS